jgi:hypothetical protein
MKKPLQKFIFSILKTFTAEFFVMPAFICIPLQLLGQPADDFSDGDFLNNPAWTGNDSKFVVSSGALELQAPAVEGIAYLVTPSEALEDATWEFSVRFDFNPSSSNYARIYLVSDQPDVSSSLNGYFVMAGGSQDEISLYQQTGTTRSKIIDGVDGRLNLASPTVRVKVSRDGSGNWELFSDAGITGTYSPEGTTNDVTHLSSGFLGIFCAYTATRSDKFFFDDFIVSRVSNSDPEPVPAKNKDVIITEIFADPSPREELPEAEFIELFNRDSDTVALKNWTLTDGNSTGTLQNLVLLPGEYLILTSSSSQSLFSPLGPVTGLSGFPSLNNSGDVIVLKNADGTTIDSVRYSDTWYKSDVKRSGGWSLELIDPNNLCSEGENWSASEDPMGGTPGRQNSIFANKPDLAGPRLIAAFATAADTLRLVFNEKLENIIPEPEEFLLTPTVAASSVSFTDASLMGIDLVITPSLQPGVLYSVVVNEIRDCSGNAIQADFNSMEFALPQPPESLDLRINEVLFNPRPTGVDFVEIVNTSGKYINLKNWSVANVEDGVKKNERRITTQDLLVKPGAYHVLTEDGNALKNEYVLAREETFNITTLPSFNDDEGSVALLDDQGNVIDSFAYTDDLHSIFIQDAEGVSLERIDLDKPTQENENWKSASAASGFATPGYRNSNAYAGSNNKTDESIIVQPEIFVPAFGQPDFTQIHYRFDQGGLMANVVIYNANGQVVKRLANNELLGTEGSFRWDGDRDDGSKARVGYYMVCVEVFDGEGEVKVIRKRVAISSR